MKSLFSPIQPDRILRWSALGFWALTALAFLTFFWLDLRLDFSQLLVPCQGTDCNWMALSSAEVDVLHSWGLSTQFYALFMTGTAVVTVAVYWFLGGLLLWRQGATRIGLSISLVLLVIPISLISDSGNVYLSVPSLAIPWVVLSAFGRIFILLFIYLFPNGRIYPRWAAIPLGMAVLVTLFTSILEINEVSLASPTLVSLLLVTFGLGFLGGVFQIVRFLRSSTLVEQQQTKWALLGMIVLILSIPIWILFFGGGLDIPPGEPRLLGSLSGWLIIMLLMTVLPVTISIAILRYRLWDIGVLVRRTLLYTVLTAFLGLVYFGLVTLMQNVFAAVSGQQSTAAIVISTLAIAALFNPLRRRLQDFIDRRFYRQKYDAEQALIDFAAVSRSETNLENLINHLAGTVLGTLQPKEVKLWLRPSQTQERSDGVSKDA